MTQRFAAHLLAGGRDDPCRPIVSGGKLKLQGGDSRQWCSPRRMQIDGVGASGLDKRPRAQTGWNCRQDSVVRMHEDEIQLGHEIVEHPHLFTESDAAAARLSRRINEGASLLA